MGCNVQERMCGGEIETEICGFKTFGFATFVFQFLKMGAQASASPFVRLHLACQTCQTLIYLASRPGAWEGGYSAITPSEFAPNNEMMISIAQPRDTTKHAFY